MEGVDISVLKDSGVLEFVKQQIVPPTNPEQLAQRNKNDTKVRRIILEGIGDHIIPHLHEKKIAYEMVKAILYLNRVPVMPGSLLSRRS